VSTEACYPPLQLQIWNACERNETSIAIPAEERLTIRGVKAAYYEVRSRLELYTGVSTIVMFAEGDVRHRLEEAARQLRSLDGRVVPGDPLPRRVPSVLRKRSFTCDAISPD
jgi:hypothetical protein